MYLRISIHLRVAPDLVLRCSRAEAALAAAAAAAHTAAARSGSRPRAAEWRGLGPPQLGKGGKGGGRARPAVRARNGRRDGGGGGGRHDGGQGSRLQVTTECSLQRLLQRRTKLEATRHVERRARTLVLVLVLVLVLPLPRLLLLRRRVPFLALLLALRPTLRPFPTASWLARAHACRRQGRRSNAR